MEDGLKKMVINLQGDGMELKIVDKLYIVVQVYCLKKIGVTASFILYISINFQ